MSKFICSGCNVREPWEHRCCVEETDWIDNIKKKCRCEECNPVEVDKKNDKLLEEVLKFIN